MDSPGLQRITCPNLTGKDLITAAKCFTLSNGVQMPIMGLGTWKLNGEKLYKGICGALSEGYALIDTAALYNNEKEIREILKEAGNPRVWLTTKLNPEEANDKQNILKAFEKSRTNLGVQQIDLYLIHWPASGRLFTTGADSAKKRIETWKVLEELYEEEKVRAIGVSNFMICHLEELLKVCKVKPMVNQIEWHPFCWNPEMISFAKENKILLQAYCSLGSGAERLLDNDIINEIAEEVEETAPVVLLRWPIEEGIAVIPSSSSLIHFKENKKALEVHLTEEQINKINSIEEKKRFCWNPEEVP